jgi:hypothetical protein
MTHRRKDAQIARNWDTIENAGGGYILSFGQDFGNQSIKVVEVLLSRSRIKETRRAVEVLRNISLPRRESALQGEKMDPRLERVSSFNRI